MYLETVFITVADCKSFTAAAKELNKTTSAVSKQINLLEEKLGVQLFNRTTRNLTITKAGELFYEHCIEASQIMDSAYLALTDLSKESSGEISITWAAVMSSAPEIHILKGFCEKYPKIKLDIRITNENLSLTNENIDFAIRVTSPEQLKDSSLVALKIGYLQPIICAAPSIVKQYGMPKSVRDAMNLPQVIPTYFPIKHAMKRYFPEIDTIKESEHHRASDVNALYNMVKMGLGAGFIGKHIVAEDLARGDLIDLTKDAIPKLPIYLQFSKQQYIPRKNRLLIDYYKEVSRDIDR